MPKQKQPVEKRSKTAYIVGEAGFAKISAVEGIRLKPAMKARAADATERGFSAEKRRETIVRAHRKA